MSYLSHKFHPPFTYFENIINVLQIHIILLISLILYLNVNYWKPVFRRCIRKEYHIEAVRRQFYGQRRLYDSIIPYCLDHQLQGLIMIPYDNNYMLP